MCKNEFCSFLHLSFVCLLLWLPLLPEIGELYLRKAWLWQTSWSRVFLEKLTGSQPVKKFPTFYGTWKFITAFTSAHHLSLS